MSLQLHPWPEHIEVVEQLSNNGEIMPSDRYTYNKIIIEGKHYFYKQARDDTIGMMLDYELLWVEFMHDLTEAYPDISARALKTYAYHPKKAIITEFIEAPFLAQPDTIVNLEPSLDRYVALLVTVDTFGRTWQPATPLEGVSTPYTQLDKRWDVWIEAGNLIEKDILTNDQLELARQRVSEYQSVAEPCMQHGDFIPWHIFDKDSEWIIFDAEHASNLFPRFYDLAYSYSRFYTRGKNKPLADLLINKFIVQSDIDRNSFFAKFLPVLLSRAIGMLLDAENDIQSTDYRQEAQNLLTLCLSARTIDDLIS